MGKRDFWDYVIIGTGIVGTLAAVYSALNSDKQAITINNRL
jgi:thioredoxin reductase